MNRSKIASQLTRGPSWAPQSSTRRSPNSRRACSRTCIFSPTSTALRVTHLTGRLQACLLSAACTPPDARSAVFWRDPRKPCWHSLPCSWVAGTVAASANKPFVCSRPRHQLIHPPAQTSFSATLSHVSGKDDLKQDLN